MTKKTKSIAKSTRIIVIIIALVFFIIIAIIASGTYGIYQDSKEVACEKLPTVEEVNQVLTDHPNEVRQISEIFLPPFIETFRCLGKEDILISYEIGKDRAQIKKIIGNNFFGVPYRMSNN